MTYTILSATFANSEHTSAVIQTSEAGAVAVSQVDTPTEWAAMLASTTPAAFSIPVEEFSEMVTREYTRRVSEVIPALASARLQNHDKSNKLTGPEKVTFRAVADWVDAMAADRDRLIAASDMTFREDRHWTVPDPSIPALASRF